MRRLRWHELALRSGRDTAMGGRSSRDGRDSDARASADLDERSDGTRAGVSAARPSLTQPRQHSGLDRGGLVATAPRAHCLSLAAELACDLGRTLGYVGGMTGFWNPLA